MAAPPLSKILTKQCVEAYLQCGRNTEKAAGVLGIARGTLQHRLRIAVRYGQLDTCRAPATPPLPIESIEQARIDRLEADLDYLREENRRLSEERLSAQRLKQLIHDCNYQPKPPKWLAPKFTPNLTGVPTLFLSDWHWDEVVKPEQINGVNAYNREIAVRRLQDCFTKAETLMFDHMRKPQYDYCNVIMGGDMLSGNIHEELRETNEVPIAKSVLHMVDQLVAGLMLLHNKFGKLYIPCVVGNHGRFDKKPRAKNRAYDSHEWYLYHFLAKHFRTEPDIHFDIADGAFLPFQTYNTRYLLAHGDQAKGGSGIAGALSPLMLLDHRTRKRAMAIDQPYDILLLGHWHQLMDVKGMRINGSGKGYDEWAMSMGFDWELPAQDLWVTHPDYNTTAEWPIYLEKKGATFS